MPQDRFRTLRNGSKHDGTESDQGDEDHHDQHRGDPPPVPPNPLAHRFLEVQLSHTGERGSAGHGPSANRPSLTTALTGHSLQALPTCHIILRRFRHMP